MYTDAMNLFELVCNSRALPCDKNHRIGVLSLREDRLCRRLRHVIHIPTGIMLADALTKRMTSAIFMLFLTTSVWDTRLGSGHHARIRRAARRLSRYSEQDLLDNRFESASGSLGEQLDLDELFSALPSALALLSASNNELRGSLAHRFGI